LGFFAYKKAFKNKTHRENFENFLRYFIATCQKKNETNCTEFTVALTVTVKQ